MTSDAASPAEPTGVPSVAGGATLPDPTAVPAPWLRQYPRGVPAAYDLPAVTLDRLLDDAAQDFPDTVALRFGRRRLTYRELQDQSDRCASGLQRLGVRVGDRVGVALRRTPQALITLFAAWRLGAVAVLLDPAASTAELAGACRRLRCAVLVCGDRHGEHLSGLEDVVTPLLTGPEDALAFPRNLAARARRHLRRGGRGAERFSDLIHRNEPLGGGAPFRRRSDGPSAAALVTTVQAGPASASAGADAPVQRYSHGELLAAAFHLRLWIPDVVAGAERMISGLPLHTALGLTTAVTMPVLSGATMVLVQHSRRRSLVRAAEAADPTLLFLPEGRGADVIEAFRGGTPSLRLCLEAGIVDHTRVPDAERRSGARLRGAWAPPGCAGIVVAEPVYGLTKRGSAGVPVTDTRVLVVGDDGAPAAPGTAGTLLVAGPQMGGDAWHDTGARAALDTEGYVSFVPGGGGNADADAVAGAPASEGGR